MIDKQKMNNPETVNFRQHIKNAIADLRVSIAMVARKADCNHQTLYNYLSGRTDAIHSDILERVLNVLQEIKAEKPKTYIRVRDK